MDVEQFDRIAKMLGSGASRRRLLRLGSALLLVGLLAAWQWEAAGAERPHERLQDRTPQRNRRQRTKNDNNNDNKNNNPDQNNGPDPGRRDADGDGLGAATERRLGTDTANPDTDGDGVTDRSEFFDQEDPCRQQCSAALDKCIDDCETVKPCFDAFQGCFEQSAQCRSQCPPA